MHQASNIINRSKRLQDAGFRWLVGAILTITAVVFLLPMLVVVALSFDARSYLGPLPPVDLSWHWYQRFFSNDLYISALATSLEVGVVSVLISTSVGVAAALAIHRDRFFGRDALLSLFMAPLIVPAVVVGFSLVLFLGSVGITGGFYRLVAGHVLITLPYCIRTTLVGLQGIPPSLREAALVLGAREWSAFWSVIFPLAGRGIMAGAIFSFAMSLDDVSVSLFLVEPPYYTLPVALLTQMRANFDLTIAAVGTMLMVFTIILIALLNHLFGLDQLFGRGARRSH